jgi:hypothetical protein
MSHLSLRAVLITVAVFLLSSLPAFSDSQVRTVRLSFVKGNVQIERGSSQQFENAMLNLPITQGSRLRASGDGRAEIEFEDGSTIRLAPNSSIEFTELVLRESGAKASSIKVNKGTAYVDFAGEKNEEFVLQFGNEKLALTHSARLRIGVGDEGAAVAVFKGDIQVEGPSGTLAVKKNQTGNFDFASNGRATLVKDIDEEPLDAWDKQQSDYHVRYAVLVRDGGPGLLRKLFQRTRVRNDVAALPGGRGVGPLYGWRVGVQSRIWVWVGIGVSVGLDALSLWKLGFSPRIWLGVAARRRVEWMVHTTTSPECAERIQSSAGANHRHSLADRESRN